MDGGKNQKWMELLRDYMINNHINHTFWCLNPNSGDTGGLLGYDFSTWDDDKYSLFEPSLWQTQESGKYISLDHKRALGTGSTSISLSDYYSSYDASEGSNIDGGSKGSHGDTKPIQSGTTSAGTTTTTTTTPETVVGDITLDGTVNVKDMILLIQYLSGEKVDSKGKDFKAGDVNGDDTLNGLDLALYRQVLSKAISGFPS